MRPHKIWQLDRVIEAGWLTVDEAAAYCSVQESTVKRAILSGGLDAVRTHRDLAGGWLIARSDVEEWAESLTQTALSA